MKSFHASCYILNPISCNGYFSNSFIYKNYENFKNFKKYNPAMKMANKEHSFPIFVNIF